MQPTPDIQPLSQLIRDSHSHKGSHGTVGIIGGNIGMLGAALLCGRAAFATGAGKVWLNVLDTRLGVDPVAPELMIRPMDADLSTATAWAVGMGLGQDVHARMTLERLLSGWDRPLLMDADALNLMVQTDVLHQELLSRRDTDLWPVLTPHAAEAGRLLGCDATSIQRDREQAARALAEKYQSVVLLKGAGTLIAHPDGRLAVNPSGNGALAVAGQGDVLSGVIVALLAQGLDAFEAARLGAYIHGLAADQYVQDAGGMIGLTSSQMPHLISQVLNHLLATL